VTSMTISLTSSLLIVGTSTGLIQLYDISSHQLLRTISQHKGMAITFLMAMLKPPDLVGHVRLGLALGANAAEIRENIPVKPIVPFQKMRDVKSREAHSVAMLFTGNRDCASHPRCGHLFCSTRVLTRRFSHRLWIMTCTAKKS
jgi:pre-rRNA-processing protein IPI3